MNSMYLLVILGVVLLVFCIIAYYLYQEAKFRKMVENTFNQKTDDILMHGNKKIVFEGESRNLAIKFDNEIIKKDQILAPENVKKSNTSEIDALLNTPNLSHSDIQETAELIKPEVQNIFADEIVEKTTTHIADIIEETHIPEDSMEAFFAKFDKVEFKFANTINKGLDLVIDVVFEEAVKIKSLCDIAQFTDKVFSFYVLDKNNLWLKFEAGKKYVISGLKLVVELVDSDGIINQAQIWNIYNTLYKFALDNHGHIRASNYTEDIENIKNSVNHIEDIELNLNLYLVAKEYIHYKDLLVYLSKNNFIEENGYFVYKGSHGERMFELADEHNKPFDTNQSYKVLTIISRMHLQQSPLITIDRIFDFAETFIDNFESRLLTTNKLVFGEKEYIALVDYINDYINSSKKYGIELGGPLLKRVC